MFTILEKTLLLKTVDLFQEIPGNCFRKFLKFQKQDHMKK